MPKTIEELGTEIIVRITDLKLYEQFVRDLLIEHRLGKCKRLDQTSGNTHTKWTLENWHGFSFVAEYGAWGMGGTEITISFGNPSKVVLSFGFRTTIGDSETIVDKFDESTDWQTEIHQLRMNLDSVIADDGVEQEVTRSNKETELSALERKAVLQEEAIRLGLKV